MGGFKFPEVWEIRGMFNLSPDVAFLGDFRCLLTETELFWGRIYLFENCMCFFSKSITPGTALFKIIIPYKDVTCAKMADAEYPPESIDITVGTKLYQFQFVDHFDVVLDTIQNGRSKHLHSQQSSKDAVLVDYTNVASTSVEIQISKDAVPEEQQEAVLAVQVDYTNVASTSPEIQSPEELKSKKYRDIFNLSQDEVLLGDFVCLLQETKLFEGDMYLFKNCMCFYSITHGTGTETKRIIPYKDVTCAKRADAEYPPQSIDISVGRKLYQFQCVESCDVVLDTIQKACSEHLHSQQISKDAVPVEQQESVLDKKTSASQERPDNCTLYFPIIADRSMIRSRILVLEKSLCTRLMWGKVQPEPEFTVHGFDLLGNPKQWTIQSEQTDFGHRQQIKFSRGWDDFMLDNQIKENDIITLKKKYRHEAAFSAHLDRWDKSTHSYERKNSCAQCGKEEEKEEGEEDNQLP